MSDSGLSDCIEFLCTSASGFLIKGLLLLLLSGYHIHPPTPAKQDINPNQFHMKTPGLDYQSYCKDALE